MSKTNEKFQRSQTIYPPEDILNPKLRNPNYEYVILWMLANNNYCEWADFKEKISESTLSGKINDLMEEGSVEKFKKGHYRITKEGLRKYNELLVSGGTDERIMTFPPEAILRGRNYGHIILWMLYHNGTCTWSDFVEEPLKINNSSLSKHKKRLVEKGFIDQSIESKEYFLTSDGKREYFRVLRSYDLDRQSILDEETRRLEEITRNTNEFFGKYEVNDNKVKFRFLNYILKLNYQKVESLLNNEEDFNKIILFLAFNHPASYPNYISIDLFANKYKIKRTVLEFFLVKIIDEDLYAVKFHKLDVLPDKEYYFQANGKFERVLRAIVDEKITKFTYLNKLQEAGYDGGFPIKLDIILEEILEEICVHLFQNGLKPALKNFLPEYIKYLAYQIETGRKLNNTDAKLESIVMQAAMDDLKSYNVTSIKTESGKTEYFYQLNNRLFEILDGFYIDKLMILKDKEFIDMCKFNDLKLYQKLIKGLKQQMDYQILKRLANSNKDELDEFQQLILDDILYSYNKNFNKALEASRLLIDKYPDNPIGYLFQSLTYFSSGNYNDALDSLNEAEDTKHQNWLVCQKAQVLSKMSKHDLANEILDEALEKDPEDMFLIRTKLVVNISKNKCCVDNPELLFDIVDNGLEKIPNSIDLKLLKVIIYCITKNYKEAKRFLDKELSDYFYDEDYPSVGTSSLFMRAFSYTARGNYEKALKDARKSMVHYEDHYTSLATKAMVLGYNLIFNFEPDNIDKEEFIELIDKAITAAPYNSIKSRLLSFKSSVFNEIGEVAEALNCIENSLMLSPEDLSLYHHKVYILYSSNRRLEAIDSIDYIIEQFEEERFSMMQTKSVVFYQMKDFESALKVNDVALKEYSNDINDIKYTNVLNNRALILAELGRKEEAIETAREMINLNEDNGNLRDSFGEILLIIGEYQDAIKQFEEAIKLSPTGWFIDQSYIKMGLCYMELGLYEKAKENFEIGKDLLEKKPPKERTTYDHNPDVYLMQLQDKMRNS